MKLLCLVKILFLNKILFSQSIAFYYGKDFSSPKSNMYEKIVVQPNNIPKHVLKNNPQKYYAYISISEFNREDIKSFAVLYRKDWNSYIADIRNPKWQTYLLKEIEKLKEEGFINFFFDNLDSYKLISKNQNEEQDFKKALIDFLKVFKEKNPQSDLILNRPLDILDEAIKYSSELVVESLYNTFDTETKKYKKNSKEETQQLLETLNRAKMLGYKIYVIDYEKDNHKRVEIARKIKENGFEPYVSDYMLKEWGSNEFEHIPRDVIFLYDSKIYPDEIFSQAHRIFSLPIEYLGYRPKIRDINNGLPKINDETQAILFINVSLSNIKLFKDWLLEAINKDIKLIFLGDSIFKTSEDILNILRIRISKNNSNMNESLKIKERQDCAFFEVEPGYINSEIIVVPDDSHEIISFVNSLNHKHVAAAITKWGGYIRDEVLIKKIFDKELLVINPFCFFEKILRKIPALDLTTENGNRILFTHIDGDGFISLYENSPQNKYASEILLEEILKKYTIPHSISIIRGEIDNPKLNNKEKEKFKNIAREIFNLPYVEPANHSYSHPYRWFQLKDINEYDHIEQVYNINIPDYKFNLYEETVETNKWIEENLVENKKVELFFWTGDCIAPYVALKLLYDNNIFNINGGYTSATISKPFLYLIGPHGIERSGLYQIYAAQTNENVYTNLWSFPFWGFEKVLETQDVTDKPLRLKPINIYYHFYSASKYESLLALKKVYNETLKKEVIPKFASEYIKAAIDFYNSEIFNYKNEWIIISKGNIKTIRTKDLLPEINNSVCGYRKINSENYIHLCSNPPYKIKIKDSQPDEPFLESSNAEIEKFQKTENAYKIILKGYIPIKYNIKNLKKFKITEKDYINGIRYVKEIELRK